MNKLRSFILLLLTVSSFYGQSSKANPLRLMVVTGGGSYENTIFLTFDRMKGINWTHFDSDSIAFSQDIKDKYDVVLFYNIGRTLEESAKANLKEFVESDKGIVVLHHALASYNNWEWWYKEVVGGRYLLKAEDNQPASTYRQDEAIMVIPVGEHPITSVLEGVPFHLYDETYKNLWISPEVTTLLRTGLSTSDGPLLWVSPYKNSRVVVFQPGHSSGAHLNLGFRTILRQAVLWAGKRLEE